MPVIICVGHIPFKISHICSEFLEHGSITGIVSLKMSRKTANRQKNLNQSNGADQGIVTDVSVTKLSKDCRSYY